MGCRCKVLSLVLLFFYSFVSTSLIAEPPTISGQDANLHEWPFIVQILDAQHQSYLCAGSIISAEWIVTAAHCMHDDATGEFYRPQHLTVGFGSHIRSDYSQLKAVGQIHIHPGYGHPRAFSNDIALLKLESPTDAPSVSLTAHIDDLRLSSEEMIRSKVAGWGLTENHSPSRFLREDEVDLVSHERCHRESNYPDIDETMICAASSTIAGNIDSCQGESGGPLVVPNPLGPPSLIGVASWQQGCGLSGFPGVYTRIYQLREWIYRTTGIPSPRKLALELDEEYGLEILNGNDFFNVMKLNERWARGVDKRWIYILPNGQTYDWKGTASRTDDIFLGTLGPDYHKNFSDLMLSQEVNRGSLSAILDRRLNFQFTGNFFTGYQGLGHKWFTIKKSDYGSWAYVTNPTGTLKIWRGTTDLTNDRIVAVLGEMFYDGALELVIDSYQGDGGPSDSEEETARVLDEYYQFRSTNSDFYNWLGLSETWFVGKHGWYYLVPLVDGATELRYWTGVRESPENDIPLARFTGNLNQHQLVNAAW